jgi:hypothetical protein
VLTEETCPTRASRHQRQDFFKRPRPTPWHATAVTPCVPPDSYKSDFVMATDSGRIPAGEILWASGALVRARTKGAKRSQGGQQERSLVSPADDGDEGEVDNAKYNHARRRRVRQKPSGRNGRRQSHRGQG